MWDGENTFVATEPPDRQDRAMLMGLGQQTWMFKSNSWQDTLRVWMAPEGVDVGMSPGSGLDGLCVGRQRLDVFKKVNQVLISSLSSHLEQSHVSPMRPGALWATAMCVD